mmetsp:Transcript_16672/g.29181  ORF Transcript_16672/g.29181 Transcript_16672/m.29181 type:complete len:172 (-) Transcript_16672:22-537(-)
MSSDDGVSLERVVNAILLGLTLFVLLWKAFPAQSGQTKKSKKTSPPPAPAEPEVPLGEELTLRVEEIHFGQPRCRVRSPGFKDLSTLIKCPADELATEKIDVARIRVELESFWVAQGTRSNRLLFVMKKRGEQPQVTGVVVEAPERQPVLDGDEPEPETYGAEFSKIQLIP